MKIKDREKYRDMYIENVYKKSWTFEKLTQNDQNKILDILYNLKLYGNDIKQLSCEMQQVYCAFLEALDYTYNGWRE